MTRLARAATHGFLLTGAFVAGFALAFLFKTESPSRPRWPIPQVVHTGNHDDGGTEMKVRFPERPDEARPLFRYARSASAAFSPDGEWCAVHDLCGSSGAELRLFRRRGDLDYVEETNITDAAWAFFKAHGNKLPDGAFDHQYVNPVAWIPGERPLLLVSLSGHGCDGKQGIYTDCWLCLYDVERKTFRDDFAASDDAGIEIVKPGGRD